MIPLHKPFGDGEDTTADAALQWEAPFPFFGGEQGAMLLDVLGINPLQFVGGGSIEDKGIHLIVETKRAGIEVCGADGAEEAVHHHHLAVVETAREVIDLCTALHQLSHLKAHNIVVSYAVALRGDHELHPYTTLQCSA